MPNAPSLIVQVQGSGIRVWGLGFRVYPKGLGGVDNRPRGFHGHNPGVNHFTMAPLTQKP